MCQGTEVASFMTDVSPSYLSSDLFTPYQRRRTTAPSIGIQTSTCPPPGGKTWGENPTNYGGIGKRPFMDAYRVKDLLVSRSHRHYGSGCPPDLTGPQPYHLTPLKLSDCRLNDERLPKSLDLPVLPRLRAHPALVLHPYTSHISKEEVFPYHEKDWTKRGKFPIVGATHQALADYHRNVYLTSGYQATFYDPYPKTEDNFMDFTTGPDDKEEDPATEKDIDSKDIENEKAGYSDDDVTEESHDGTKTLLGLAPCWPPKCYIIDPVTLKIVESGLTKTLLSPVASNSLKGIRKLTRHRKAPFPKKTVHFQDENKDFNQDEFSKFPVLPTLTPSEKEIYVPMGPDLSWLPVPIGEQAEKEATDKYSWFWRHHLYPAPCINNEDVRWKRNNISQKLGVCFKTDAHKKYHKLHPEPVPDLRDSMVYHKKYFFHGYHSTAFRG